MVQDKINKYEGGSFSNFLKKVFIYHKLQYMNYISRYAMDAGLMANYMVEVKHKAHKVEDAEGDEELTFDVRDYKVKKEVQEINCLA